MGSSFQIGDKAISIVDGPRVIKMGQSYSVLGVCYCPQCNQQMIDIGYASKNRVGKCRLCGGLWPTMGRKWVGARFFIKEQELDFVLYSVLENSVIPESIKS